MGGAPGWLRQRTAEEIRVLLARKRMSAAELARRTGLKQSTLARRMTGEIPFDLDDLEVIAGALEVDVTELLPRAVTAQTSSVTNVRLPHVGRMASVRSAKRRGDGTIGHNHSPIGYGRRDSTRPESPIAANRRRPTQIG